MSLIALGLGRENSAHEYVKIWVEHAGGSMSREELEARFERVYHFKPWFLTNRTDMVNFGVSDLALKLEGDVVSLPPVN